MLDSLVSGYNCVFFLNPLLIFIIMEPCQSQQQVSWNESQKIKLLWALGARVSRKFLWTFLKSLAFTTCRFNSRTSFLRDWPQKSISKSLAPIWTTYFSKFLPPTRPTKFKHVFWKSRYRPILSNPSLIFTFFSLGGSNKCFISGWVVSKSCN